MKKPLTDPFNANLQQSVLAYIENSWTLLKRSQRDLLHFAIDPKFSQSDGHKYIVHIAPTENKEAIIAQLENTLSQENFAKVAINVLPENMQCNDCTGVLYLPHPYVVPGGRFNEMYGWDSFFIILGLLHHNHIELAKGMADNLIYEIQHYHKLLCANRPYYLTRSQPPLVAQAVLAVYKKTHDKNWLADVLPALQKIYDFWTQPPHLVEKIGVSRYYDTGEGAAPEVLSSEIDCTGLDHYQRVKAYYQTHDLESYNLQEFFDTEMNKLRPHFYKGDRSLRESGFDLTSRFGPFGAKTTYFIPVCLNSLLHQMELDLAEINAILNVQSAASSWQQRAVSRATLINKYLWNDDLGYYFDFNFETKRINNYIFATTFYPLWTGIATAEQAKRIVNNVCVREAAGGLLTSAYATGQQWDAPFGWAPLHYFAVTGLARYGYHTEAKRLARKFLGLINCEFYRYSKIFEKYDLVSQTSFVGDTIQFGYDTNEVGFGWTNAVYLELLNYLQADELLQVRAA